MSQGQERRRELRHKIRLDVRFRIDGEDDEHAAFTRDISTGGMFIETSRQLAYGTRLRVRLEMPLFGARFEAGGTVCWATAGEGIGVHFEGLRAMDTWALNQLFASQGPRQDKK